MSGKALPRVGANSHRLASLHHSLELQRTKQRWYVAHSIASPVACQTNNYAFTDNSIPPRVEVRCEIEELGILLGKCKKNSLEIDMLTQSNARKILKALLLLTGVILLLAFVAVVISPSAMASGHQWLGLGEFPDRPITIYLARSTSLLYGVHGVLMVYTALTMKQHWRFVWLFGALHVLIGLTMLFTDITAGMPVYWIIGEGPPVAALGVVMIALYMRGYWLHAEQSSDSKLT